MNIFPKKALIEEVALVRRISEAFVEKDWFVTQVIKILAENQQTDFILIFTGGTALSKAHKLIHRFSEDIDFRILNHRCGLLLVLILWKMRRIR